MTTPVIHDSPPPCSAPPSCPDNDEFFLAAIRAQEHSLTRYLHAFTNNESVIEDLRQETYLEAYRSLATYHHQGSFCGWLRRIASRVVYRYWAQLSKEARAKAAYLERWRDKVPAKSLADLDALDAFLLEISPCDRMLLEMKYLEGYKASEIAAHIGWNEVRVRVRLHRSLKRLHENYSSGHKRLRPR